MSIRFGVVNNLVEHLVMWGSAYLRHTEEPWENNRHHKWENRMWFDIFSLLYIYPLTAKPLPSRNHMWFPRRGGGEHEIYMYTGPAYHRSLRKIYPSEIQWQLWSTGGGCLFSTSSNESLPCEGITWTWKYVKQNWHSFYKPYTSYGVTAGFISKSSKRVAFFLLSPDANTKCTIITMFT